jgi:hypothetical protein
VVGLPDLAEDSPLLAALAARAPAALLLLIDLPQAPAAGTAEAGREGIGKDRPLSRLFEALSYRHALRPAALSPEMLSRWVSRETTAAAAASDRAARPGVSVLLHRSEGCALLEDEGGLLPTGRLERVQGYRRSGRRRNEDTRKALELLVPDSEEGMQGQAGPTTARRPLFGSPGQILFAEMGGAVSLPGPEFVAHFVDGRLRGLARSGGELAGGAPAESWFAFDGARRVLRTVSAASFERDGDHGLATSLGVELPPGRGQLQVLIEAYFREGQPELCLECSVRFPPGAPALEAGAPYEIPLLPFDERKPPELQVELEGGRIHREMVLPREGYLLTCGRSVRAASEGAAVVLTADGAAPATVLPLRVCRESGRWSLRACLGGRTCPGRPLPVAGLTSQFSFRVGLEQA